MDGVVMNDGCFFTDGEIAEMDAQLSAVCAQRDRLVWLIGQMLGELPERRDWLNPDIEREMRAALSADGDRNE